MIPLGNFLWFTHTLIAVNHALLQWVRQKEKAGKGDKDIINGFLKGSSLLIFFTLFHKIYCLNFHLFSLNNSIFTFNPLAAPTTDINVYESKTSC